MPKNISPIRDTMKPQIRKNLIGAEPGPVAPPEEKPMTAAEARKYNKEKHGQAYSWGMYD